MSVLYLGLVSDRVYAVERRIEGFSRTYRHKGRPSQSCQMGKELFVSFIAPDVQWAHMNSERGGISPYQVDLI